MSRLVIPILLLFLLVLPSSATYYIMESSPLYEVKYSVLSNGTDALIHIQVLQWGIDCGMSSCWPAVFGAEEFLLYFNGSNLYLLNFKPALKSNYTSYAGATFLNESWYVELKYHPPTCSTQVEGFYRLDTENFCIEPVTITWFYLPRGKISDLIDGWRIELQSLGPGEWGYANVSDLWIALSENITSWSPGGPITVPKSSVFPVYFTIKKDNLTKKITLLYLNTTNNSKELVQGFWFPENIKIVNVTVCKFPTITPNETITQTTVRGNTTTPIEKTATTTLTSTTKENLGICGSGLVVIIALGIALLLKRR